MCFVDQAYSISFNIGVAFYWFGFNHVVRVNDSNLRYLKNIYSKSLVVSLQIYFWKNKFLQKQDQMLNL